MSKTISHCSSLPVKLKPLSAAVLLALSSYGAEAVTFNLSNNANVGVQGIDFYYAACKQDFVVNREFRMCQPNNKDLGGGVPFQKDTVNGSEVWDFDGAGLMIGVTNTVTTEGLDESTKEYTMSGRVPRSAAPDGGPAMDQGAIFLSSSFAFLAPFVGSGDGVLGPGADVLYGTGAYTATGAKTFELFFPVLEAQWSGVHFQLGRTEGKGITFFGTYTPLNMPDNGDGSFSMYAEHKITNPEDTMGAGFNDWSPQWYYTGTITGFEGIFAEPPFSIPAGLMGTGGITRPEIEALAGEPDTEMQRLCIGGCFDFTVPGLANGQTVEVILALTAKIPERAVYRKHDSGGWRDFNKSGVDKIESGTADGAGTEADPYRCDSTSDWVDDFQEGKRCIRLTMKEGGDNDLDGVEDGILTDPGGIGVPPPPIIDPSIPREELSGCSLSPQPASASKRADWWIVGLFLTALGIRRKLKA